MQEAISLPEVVPVTGRRHAGEENPIPGLEPLDSDTDLAESDTTFELLEGHLGPDAADRADVPTLDQQQDDVAAHAASLDDATVGRWACRFCATKRLRREELDCGDEQHQREGEIRVVDL